ncbi:MAG: hypothetical protein AB8B53_15290 [Flavobacteriales bacterium]
MSLVKENEITPGVSYEEAKRKAELIYNTKVAPFLNDAKDAKDLELTAAQKAFSKCQNPH